jgi:hypothetical protein
MVALWSGVMALLTLGAPTHCREENSMTWFALGFLFGALVVAALFALFVLWTIRGADIDEPW